jgi:hypothetical protein
MPGVSEEQQRHFTPAEAEALLPAIDRLLEAAQALVTRYEQLQQSPPARSPEANGQVHTNGAAPAEGSAELRVLEAELRRIVDQVQSQGVIVRDLRMGLIDFPALRDGVTVFLCWHRGEPLRIEWWHPTTTGIAGRQRL